jgi:pimeloyl-ACP methyl ester carboxylesterase
MPFLYRYLNFSPRILLPNSFGDKKIPKKLLKQYTGPFANKDQRNGPLAFAKSLLNDQAWFENLWDKKSVISLKPTLFIWGMKDPFITPRNLMKFVEGFPNSKTYKIETAGHFPQEEETEKVIREIRDFLN